MRRIHPRHNIGAHLPILDDPVTSLKYIGPHFASNFARDRDGPIVTLRELMGKLNRNTRGRNTTYLRRVFLNPRRRQAPASDGCLGPGSRRPAGGNRYKVNRINTFAHNAVISYFRRKRVMHPASGQLRALVPSKLPNIIPRRTYANAYPPACP